MTAIPRVPGPRYAALLELLRTAEVVWQTSRAFFARWELGPSQFNVLNLLADLPAGMSQVDLSRELLMHRSNVTGLVDRLEARGLVRRRDVVEDRRAYRVVLTAAGRRLTEEILPHYYAAAEAVWGDFPVRRVHQLAADLRRIATQAERMAGNLPS
jgi:DNA-binding MarR family transcriptional regulator